MGPISDEDLAAAEAVLANSGRILTIDRRSALALIARLRAAEADRKHWIEQLALSEAECRVAEGEAARYREALAEMTAALPCTRGDGSGIGCVHCVARAALAHQEETNG